MTRRSPLLTAGLLLVALAAGCSPNTILADPPVADPPVTEPPPPAPPAPTPAPAEPPASVPTSSDSLEVFLLIGQSNMAGRGPLSSGDPAPMAGVYALTSSGGWTLARDPLHFDKPTVAAVGPGVSFGQTLHGMRPDRTVGLVPGAVGGTSVRVWEPGARDAATNTRPYDDAIARTRAVLSARGGRLAGVLWHQGESDGGSMSSAEYARRLDALIARLRAEFGLPNLPFIAGQLAPYYIAGHPTAAAINDAVAGLPGRVPNTAVVTAEGLTDKGDGTHLDASSARTLGRRYAAAMAPMLPARP